MWPESQMMTGLVSPTCWFKTFALESTKYLTVRKEFSDQLYWMRYYIPYRLQNSLYFCVFKYSRAVKQKVWNEAENRERDWGETSQPHTPYGRVSLARFAPVRLLRHALLIALLILRKKPTVLQSTSHKIRAWRYFSQVRIFFPPAYFTEEILFTATPRSD